MTLEEFTPFAVEAKSEAQCILDRYMDALHKATRAAMGHPPIVCVAGKHDYEALMGTLQTLFGMPILHLKPLDQRLNGPHKVMGITIVPSYGIETGFYFGSEDNWYREQENKPA